MTELLIIRHGETDWNLQHRFQGQIDVPLNATGQLQAQRLAAALINQPIDVLLCSDLQRARATALTVAARRSAAQPATDSRADSTEVLVEPLWREQSFGVLEGLDVATIQRQHAPLWAQWIRHEAGYALPDGGESNIDFFGRIGRALDALLTAHAGKRVAVVTHGGVLDMLWRRAHRLSLDGPRECDIPNTGINAMRFAGGQLQITRWAQADHLLGLPAQPSTVQRRHHQP